MSTELVGTSDEMKMPTTTSFGDVDDESKINLAVARH
jgi:hypothetical protein